jgi:hypothetical protein
MPTTVLVLAALDRGAAAPVLDLEARLALADAAMTLRLDQAAVAFEVNTAHIPAEPVDLTTVLPLQPTIAPALHATPIAACLQRAHTRLAQAGWCTGGLRDEQGAVCLIGAIRAAASSRGQADDACVLLLEAIQREFTAETVPSWNDRQRGPAIPLRMLDQAAQIADQRGI